MPSLGDLFVRLGLKTDDLEKGSAKAKRGLFGVRDAMREVRDDAGKVALKLGAVGAALAGGAIALAYKAGEAASEIKNLSQVANASTREFQRNAAAAREVGIEGEKLADIYKDMNDRIGDFLTTGGGPMADFFEKIAPQVGVTAEQFARLSGPEAMQLFVKSLEDANVGQQEMTFYMEAIAGDATRLLPLLRDGGKEMRELGDRAEETGEILSAMELDQLEEAKKRIDELKASLGRDFMRLIADNADQIVTLAENLSDLAIKAITAANAMGHFFGILGAGNSYDGLLKQRVDETERLSDLTKQLEDEEKELARLQRARGDERDAFGERIAKQEIERLRAEIGESEEEVASLDERIAKERERLQELRQLPGGEGDEPDVGGGSGGGTETVRRRVTVETEGGGEDALAMGADRAGARAEQARAELAIVRDSLKTEAELEQDHFESQLEILRDNLELRLVTKEEFDLLEQDLEQSHQDRLTELYLSGLTEREQFEQSSMKRRVATVSGELARMTAGVAQHNKQLFELNKAAGISQAIISTHTAVTKALEAYPPPISFAMAAAQAAAGFAEVNAIKSQSFGGGGGTAPSLAGSTPAPAVSNVGSGGGGQVIAIEGLDRESLFTGKAVRQLIDEINEAAKDGAKVVFS